MKKYFVATVAFVTLATINFKPFLLLGMGRALDEVTQPLWGR
jgi:hypothetical protein